jgi:hypothetical protein
MAPVDNHSQRTRQDSGSHERILERILHLTACNWGVTRQTSAFESKPAAKPGMRDCCRADHRPGRRTHAL